MNAKVDTQQTPEGTSALDIAKIVLGALIAVAGAVAYYWFEDQGHIALRMLGLVTALGVGSGLILWSGPGARIRDYVRQSQIEVRKVVWPTRQETWQTTAIIGVAVLLIGILIWIIDMILAGIVRWTMGG